MYLLAALATSGALLQSPPSARRWDRRSAVQTAGGMLATSFTWPSPVFASSGGSTQTRFEDVRNAVTSSLSSSSPLVSKFSNLARVNLKDDPGFLFLAPSLCKAAKGTRFVSVRLWRPTGGGDVRSILESFEARFAKEKQKPDGFRCYYGAVVLDEETTSQYALLANVVETKEQAEILNTKELALVKKKLVRADLSVAPIFADSQLEAKLGGCVEQTFVEVID